MKQRLRHRWDMSPRDAIAWQERAQGRVSTSIGVSVGRLKRAGRIAAVDVAYDRKSDRCFAAMVVWDVAAGETIAEFTHAAPSTYPYVPGLLSFREIPPLLPLFRRLRDPIDLILCDGQGIAHPRRFGLACHLGVLYDTPTLGWAKTRLIGEHREPGNSRGRAAPLKHKGEQIGRALRSREACNPTFVSPGHLVSMKGALEIARALLGKHRLCEPARAAHAATGRAMRAAESIGRQASGSSEKPVT